MLDKTKLISKIHDYENKNGSLEIFCEYITKRSNLIDMICLGEAYLPSSKLLKDTYEVLSKRFKLDQEMQILFNLGIDYSNNFYDDLVNLIVKQKQFSVTNLEKEFEEHIQPIGQKLVNIINSIKSKIRVLKLLKTTNYKFKKLKLSFFSFFKYKNIYNACVLMRYQTEIWKYKYSHLITKYYYFFIASLILLLWSANISYFNSCSSHIRFFFNATCTIAILLLSMIYYPIDRFANKDISGANVLAYAYKMLLLNSQIDVKYKLLH